MRNYEDRIIALDCLRLAHDGCQNFSTSVERAAAYFAFVTGTETDARTLEIVRAAVNS